MTPSQPCIDHRGIAFDAEAATAGYIDGPGADTLAKAAAYTRGGREIQQHGPNLRAFLVGTPFFLVMTVLSLPWRLYEGWWRERSYGRSSQPLMAFLGQGIIAMLLSAVLGALFIVGAYALIRRAGRAWWIWSAGLAAVALTALLLAAPIFIEPLFSEINPVPAGEVRDALVVMARRAGVPTDRIFVYDESRQSNNFTANVAGLGSTARIAISDVAFKGVSLDEVKAVTGHEMGHYVLGHVWQAVGVSAGLAILFFFLADRLFPVMARASGSSAALSDPVSLPVLMFMASLFGLLAQPALNALNRIDEIEADRYSLETVDLPDALASAPVKAAEYRYPRPTRIEEAVFYDHPSVERRVRTAMEWKATHADGTADDACLESGPVQSHRPTPATCRRTSPRDAPLRTAHRGRARPSTDAAGLRRISPNRAGYRPAR